MNVLNFEMEAATIYTIANIHGGARAGGIMAVIANRKTNEFVPDAGVDEPLRWLMKPLEYSMSGTPLSQVWALST